MSISKLHLYMGEWKDIDKQALLEGNCRNPDIMVALVANIGTKPDITTQEIADYTNLPKEDLDACLQEFIDCGMVIEKYE